MIEAKKRNVKTLFSVMVWLILLIGCTGILNLDERVVGPAPGTLPKVIEGITLQEKLQDLRENAVSNKEYIIEITGSGNMVAQDLVFSDRHNISILLTSKEKERVIQLTDNGSLFNIGTGVTLIIDNNITLRGYGNNNAPLIVVNSRGSLTIKTGAKISNNADTRWNGSVGGVYVGMDGSFFMKGGEICNKSGNVGGVYVADGGYFEMSGGKIAGNTASSVGGVKIENGRFLMTGGEICNNTSSGNGCGVYVTDGGNFEMEGGAISGNTADGTYNGGGVYVDRGKFTMSGGEIFGNTANSGGGVFVTANALFNKISGTIYGKENNKANTATSGITSNDRGHAVFVNSSPSRRRETTAIAQINLNSGVTGAAGGWE